MRVRALALVFLLTTASAFAQAPLSFADVDTDGSGELSFAELAAVWQNITQEEFDRADADGTGGLSPQELDTLQPATLPLPGQ